MLTLANAIIVKMHVKTNLLFPPLLHRSLETDVYDPQHKTPSIRVIRHPRPCQQLKKRRHTRNSSMRSNSNKLHTLVNQRYVVKNVERPLVKFFFLSLKASTAGPAVASFNPLHLPATTTTPFCYRSTPPPSSATSGPLFASARRHQTMAEKVNSSYSHPQWAHRE